MKLQYLLRHIACFAKFNGYYTFNISKYHVRVCSFFFYLPAESQNAQ